MTVSRIQAARPGAAGVQRVRAVPAQGVPVTWAIVGLMTLAVLAIGTVSPELLALLKVHYISANGIVLEKIHPATYLALLAFLLMVLRGGDPVGEFNRMLSDAKPVLVFFFTCGLLLFQCVVLKRPVTALIDAFILPVLLSLIYWNLSLRERKPLVVAIHAVIWINVVLAFYEYFSKHRLVPITLGNQIVLGDWRSTALLGHPASAAAAVAIYTMTLLLRPKTEPLPLLALPAMLLSSASLMVFGGRTALVALVVVFAGFALWNCLRLMRGDRFGLAAVIVTTLGLMAAGAAASFVLASGVFDNMLDRFAHDSNSAQARIASVHLLSYFDWKELMLGTEPTRSAALQNLQGLTYGIEDFWIACIVQYGIVQTALITVGLGCFLAEVLRRAAPGARVTVLFVCVVAASSVSFSAKNIALALDVSIIVLLLPKARPAAAHRWYGDRAGAPYSPAVAAR